MILSTILSMILSTILSMILPMIPSISVVVSAVLPTVVPIAFCSNPASLGVPPIATDGAKPNSGRPAQVEGLPRLPATPAAVREVVESVPFVLDTPYVHEMRKERREVVRGHVLVLRCDPAYLLRRQVAEPVLVAGDETAERINIGFESGVLVAIVPEWSAKAADGAVRAVDPLTAPIYFATPELPERVDAAWIVAEGAKAQAAGIGTAPLARDARRQEVRFADRDALNRFLSDLVVRHAPLEAECAAALRGESLPIAAPQK